MIGRNCRGYNQQSNKTSLGQTENFRGLLSGNSLIPEAKSPLLRKRTRNECDYSSPTRTRRETLCSDMQTVDQTPMRISDQRFHDYNKICNQDQEF